ncbi:MAG: hypothetical protein HYS20_12665 [Rhodocyclales bacterium]|nr:hypothetical protein [Rhodocyclales bacterium]
MRDNIPLICQNLCLPSFIDVPESAYLEGTLGVYELKAVELLRDVFVWAYERSCQRYMAIQPPPTSTPCASAIARRSLRSWERSCAVGWRRSKPP